MKSLLEYKTVLSTKVNPWIRYLKWQFNLAPIPSPALIKLAVIRRATKISPAKLFIETGTYKGDTVNAVKDLFDQIISIEIDKDLYTLAVERFKSYPNVSIQLGDSSQILPSILASVNQPALFWLDGHYSGGETGCGEKVTPIEEEIKLIKKNNLKNHTILIDDIRLFNGKDGYPKLGTLINIIESSFPEHQVTIEHDILVCCPTP